MDPDAPNLVGHVGVKRGRHVVFNAPHGQDAARRRKLMVRSRPLADAEAMVGLMASATET